MDTDVEAQPGTGDSAGSSVREPVTSPATPLRFCLLLLAIECLWLLLVHAAFVPTLVWFSGHVAICALMAAWCLRSKPKDMSGQVLALIATLIAGPLGAALALLAVVWLSRAATNTVLLAAWYDRIALAGDIDPVTRLCNTVSMGRAVQTTKDIPQVFAAVMAGGSLEDRQTALGLIARKFSPSYAPALRAALVSSEPVIRVQAAAVAVKVRAELKNTLHARLVAAALPLPPSRALSLAGELHDLAATGLLEDIDRDAALVTVKRLAAQAVDAKDDAAVFPELTAGARAVLENELLARGSFAAFRAVRSSATPGDPNGG